MDEYTEKHLLKWLGYACPPEIQCDMYFKIREFVENHPDTLDYCSWPQIRDLVERNEKEKIQ
jgi:hypothetical protein